MNDVYVVKKGDTLYGISNQYGVSVIELATLNNVKADTLQVGQTLIIPSKSGINPDNMFMYTVKKGDNLYSIAKVYGTSVDAIKKLNYLDNDNLYIGQVIRIPEVYTLEDEMYVPQFINYTVKSGDTLYSIAKKYNLSVDTIIQDNALKNNVLTIGSNLKIRTEESVIVEECFGEDYIIPTPTTTYVVKKGDSLYSIAKTYNTSVSEIININNLKNSNLSIGQKLIIPNNSITYTVKAGDTLYSIAKKYNISVDTIKKNNNLSSNNLSVGQILKI